MKRSAILLACALLGCDSGSRGESTLSLTIQSDLSVPTELDLVTVSVTGMDTPNDPAADLLEHPLPRTLTLVHESGPLGPFPVKVYGYLGSDLVIREQLTVSFPESGNTDVTVNLERVCRNVACAPSSTCEQGKCVPIAGTDAGVDAALPDSSVRDAGMAARDAELPQDSAAQDGGAQDAAIEDAFVPPVEDANVGPGRPPTCTITLPVPGDAYQIGVALPLQGSCSDPETGALGNVTWTSAADGALGSGASASGRFRSAGTQRVSLCATDPYDATLQGCASVDVQATTTPQPAALITSVTQNGLNPPFSTTSPVTLAGSGSGAGVTLSWSDDLQGALSSASLPMPLVGRHIVTLTVRDRNGAQSTATRSFTVIAPGESGVISPLSGVNARLGNTPISSIASDPRSRAYVPGANGSWYRFDGTRLDASADIAINSPPLPTDVQDAQITGNRSYLATRNGLTVCGYTDRDGAGGNNVMGGTPCATYRAGGLLQSQNFLSVLRMVDVRNNDTLLVGSDAGLFLSDSVDGGVRGTSILRLQSINDMAALNGQAALALNTGLALLNPSTQQLVTFTTSEGLPSNTLRSVVTAANNTLWIATAAGLAHFEPGPNRITTWNSARGLPSDSCNGVAVQRVAQLGRDIVWVATANGVARLDPSSNAVTTFTVADGLPSNNVLAVHVLANGTKLFGTQSGLAHYVGF